MTGVRGRDLTEEGKVRAGNGGPRTGCPKMSQNVPLNKKFRPRG